MFNLPFGKNKKVVEEVEVEYGDIKTEDIVAPSLIEIKQNYLKLGERMAKTFFVFSYPRYLSTGWLSPLINLDAPLDISLHIHPADSGAVLKKLRKKLTEVQAEISEKEEKGIIRDPSLDIAYQDIEQLRDELQTARERIFQLGVYITIYGDTDKELKDAEVSLRSMLESRLVYLKPALLKEKQGFISVCPYALDQLMVHTPMNTAPLSSIFPFVSPDLSANEGILYGINQHNNSLVLFDRFTLENANLVIFAKSGGGKSVKATDVVLVKYQNKVRLLKIGSFIDKIIKKQGIDFHDEELEGKTFPGIKVWTFDENMKGNWGEVKVAARKNAPKIFYKFLTKSGREITTTGDHNLVVLESGKIKLFRGDEVKEGMFVPLPREIILSQDNTKKFFNLLKIFSDRSDIYIKGLSLLRDRDNTTQCSQKEVISIQDFHLLSRIAKLDAKSNKSMLTLILPYGKIEIPAFIEIDDAFLRLLGYIASEGAIGDRYIMISNTDPEFNQDVKKCLDKIKISYCQTTKSINIATLLVVEFIKKIGAGGKSGHKQVCPFIFGLPKEFIAQYLSAYFEGDGGVEVGRVTVSAVSKSEKLISDIAYLLYYFGIVSRITKTKKQPINSNWKEKKVYWKLSISGQDNLKKFAQQVNFISQRKRQQLAEVVQKTGNTNVDLIPGVAPIFKEIYNLFSCGLHNIQDVSNIKRGHYSPSPEKLKEMISVIEERVEQFKNKVSTYKILSELPSLSEIIRLGENDKQLNKELWRHLGHGWHVVKYRGVKPGFVNASKMLEITTGRQYELTNIKQIIHSGFREAGLQFKYFNRSLQPALTERLYDNTCYDMVQQAAQYVWQKYQEILQYKIPVVQERLAQLKFLANADLFWDPIVKAEKIENKTDEYVYDLMCENGVFLAGRGGMFVHNSFFTKVEVLRYLMQGVKVIVVDPENEYEFLSEAVGGSFFRISLNSEHHLNPFDLPAPRDDERPQDVLRSNVINLVGLLRIMLGGLTPQEDAIIDQALTETYASRDITTESNPATWQEKIPIMSDFEEVLAGMQGSESLLERVRKFTKGSYANFFNTRSNVDMENGFVVFGIRDMEDELRPMAMFVILRYIWNQVRATLQKRILLVDEAWWIMQSEDGASFLFGICKRARKYWLGVTTVTQDVSDFMRSEYGKPIITNSSLQLLMKQSPATIELVQKTFALTDGEKNLLLQCDVGEGVFVAGQKRVAMKVVASYTEEQIITSSPEEVVKIKEARRQLRNE